MKRILAMVLCIAMLVSLMPSAFAGNAAEPSLSGEGGSVYAEPDEGANEPASVSLPLTEEVASASAEAGGVEEEIAAPQSLPIEGEVTVAEPQTDEAEQIATAPNEAENTSPVGGGGICEANDEGGQTEEAPLSLAVLDSSPEGGAIAAPEPSAWGDSEAEAWNLTEAEAFEPVLTAISGECGENLTWTLDTTGTLTISGDGAMTDYDSVNSINAVTTVPWRDNCDNVQSVVISSGVTHIGNCAFEYCKYLTSVTIPDSVTTIGKQAFFVCTGLTSVTIPFGVTTIGDEAFYGCSKLGSVAIPESVTSVGGWAFSNCTGLTSVTLPSSLTAISECAFEYCRELTSVAIPIGVTTIGVGAFSFCSNLASVAIPRSVTSIEYEAFYKCAGLTDVYYGGTETQWDAITIGGSNASLTNATVHFADPEPTFVASGTCGENLTWTLDEEGMLTISGTGAMADYSLDVAGSGYSTAPWDAYSYSIKTIVISSGVTSIGDCAFFICYYLTSVTIPNSVTSIGACAFENSSSLTSITIPNSVTSIGSAAFCNCSNLASVTIGDSVTSIGSSAFEHCASLTSITIPDSVTSIEEGAFYGCSSLTSITIPNSVTSIGSNAFRYCTALASVKIGSGVTTISVAMFYGCGSLTSVTIPDRVASIEWTAFGECTGLTDVYYAGTEEQWNAIEIGDWNDPLTNATIRFADPEPTFVASGECGENLTWTLDEEGTLTISGTGEMTDYDSYYDSPWYNDTRITSVIIEDGVTSVGDGIFAFCTEMESISFGSSVTRIGRGAFLHCTALQSIPLPAGLTVVDGWAFQECSAVTSITIPASVTSMDGTAFLRCSSLLSFVVESGSAAFTAVEGVLYNASLTEIVAYPCGRTGAYTILNSATSIGFESFASCMGLTEITIPSGISEIREFTFYDCRNLTDVYFLGTEAQWTAMIIGSGNFFGNAVIHFADPEPTFVASGTCGENVTWALDDAGTLTISGTGAMTDWEWDCGDTPWDAYSGSIKTIVISSGVTTIGASAFYHCSSLTSVTIPDSVTSIGDDAFNGCSSLTSVTIPDSVTSIGGDAFSYSGLTYVTIPNSVTSIGNYAFHNCSSLTSVTIPDSVTSIGWRAFYKCAGLTDVYYGGSEEQWNAITIDGGNDPLLNAKIHFYIAEFTEMAFEYVSSEGVTTYHASLVDAYTNGQALDAGQGTIRLLMDYAISTELAMSTTSVIANPEASIVIDLNGHTLTDSTDRNLVMAYADGFTLTLMNGTYLKSGVRALVALGTSASAANQVRRSVGVIIRDADVFAYGSNPLISSYIANVSVALENSTFYTPDAVMITLQSNKNWNDTVTSNYAISLENVTFTGKSLLWASTGQNSASTPAANCTASLTLAGANTIRFNRADYAPYNGILYRNTGVWTSLIDPANGYVTAAPEGYAHVISLNGDTPDDGEYYTVTTSFAAGHVVTWHLLDGSELQTAVYDGSAPVAPSFEILNLDQFLGWSLTEGGEAVDLTEQRITSDTEYYMLGTLFTGIAFGKCGENLTWVLGKDGTLTIFGEGAMWDFESEEAVPWNDYRDIIRAIELGEGITSIGPYAFDSCEFVKEVTIPDSVVSLGVLAFANCTAIEWIHIGSGLTSLPATALANLPSLRAYTVSEAHPAFVAEDGVLLYPSGKILLSYPVARDEESYTIPSGIRQIFSYAFYGAQKLRTIEIPQSVVYVQAHAFEEVDGLEKVIYCGAADQWEYVAFGGGNEVLRNAPRQLHNYVYHSQIEPDCVDYGGVISECTICGEKHIDYIAPLGHDWNEGVVEKEATDTETGLITHTCRRCGETKTEIIPVLRKLTVKGGMALAGETVTVALDLVNNTDLIGMLLDIAYDDALTLIEMSTGEALSGLSFVNGLLSSNPTTAFWFGAEADDSNGTILYLTFAIKEGTKAGTYPITVSYDADNILNGNEENVPLMIVNGYVTVEAAPVAAIAPEKLFTAVGVPFTFSAVNSTDNGRITEYTWDFGDGERANGMTPVHTYAQAGIYVVTLTVTDDCGYTGTAIAEMEIVDTMNGDYTLVTLTVVDALSTALEPVSRATLTVTDANGETTSTLTDAEGRATLLLPNGETIVYVTANGYLPANKRLKVAHTETGTMEQLLGISKKEVVQGDLIVTPMTIEEIIDAGIDVNNPDNQHVSRIETTFEFKLAGVVYTPVDTTPITVGYRNDVGHYYNAAGGWYTYYTRTGGGGGGSIYTPQKEMRIGIFPTAVEGYYLIIYGESHWLKEMFNVELQVTNDSGIDAIENAVATLELPEGLSLAQMLDGRQSEQIALETVAPKSRTAATWYVKGDVEGEYVLSAQLTGELVNGSASESFCYNFTTDSPIKVFAGSALKMTVTADDYAVDGKTYPVSYRLENVSDRTLYNLSFAITGVREGKLLRKTMGGASGVIHVETYSEDFGDTYTQTVESLAPGEYVECEVNVPLRFDADDVREIAHAIYGVDAIPFAVIDLSEGIGRFDVTTREGSTTVIPYEVVIRTAEKNDLVTEAFNCIVKELTYDPANPDVIILFLQDMDVLPPAHGKCGDNLTWALDSEGTLWISGTGDMWDFGYSVTLDGKHLTTAPWGEHSANITAVHIASGVTSIGDDAFSGCGALASITIPEGVTYIGDSAFCDCFSLTNVKIPYSVRTIGRDAFYDCGSLTSVVIPDGVTSLGRNAFRWCTGLASVTIGDGLTSIESATFQYCTGLKGVTLGANVKHIGDWAFESCSSLESVVIPDGATTIGASAFYGCSALVSAFLPDSVTSIGAWAFEYCSSLTNVTIPAKLTQIPEEMFYRCSSLTHVTIPANVTTIGALAFYDCDNLTSVTISASVTRIADRAFYRCDKLTDVYFDGTEAQWKAIWIGEKNEALLDAASIYFAQELEQTAKIGDANGDGVVNGKDVTILRRYLAGGFSVDFDEAASDVNGDGVVNGKDVTILRRYLAGGYGVMLGA